MLEFVHRSTVRPDAAFVPLTSVRRKRGLRGSASVRAMSVGMPPVIGPAELQLLDKSPTPTAIVDHETLRFLAVNDAALRLFGYAREEFLGLTLSDTRHPDDDQERRPVRGSALYV